MLPASTVSKAISPQPSGLTKIRLKDAAKAASRSCMQLQPPAGQCAGPGTRHVLSLPLFFFLKSTLQRGCEHLMRPFHSAELKGASSVTFVAT